MYVNKELCAECGGKCCKRAPGIYYPSDFNLPNKNNDYSKLNIMLKSGNLAIDWWEGDPRDDKDEIICAHFVRPSIKDKKGILFDPSWGGECIFLTNKGCILDESERPLECRMLEPRVNGILFECIMHNDVSKRNAAIAWIPYNNYLKNYKS